MEKRKSIWRWIGAGMLLCWAAAPWAADYGSHPAARAFVERMASEHQFDAAALRALMAEAERQDDVLEKIARPAEKTKSWAQYRKIFLTDQRTEQGLAFMQQHRAALQRAEQRFGVPAEIITAIIGVETFYGRINGKHRVLDALATLAFDYPPRSKFFAGQLEQFLLLVREQGFDARQPLGSYAGAMGFGQFIPGSYRSYAIDFDGDDVVDIIDNPVDAIGSVANYFSRHGWRSGEQILLPASVRSDYNPALANAPLKPSRSLAELAREGYIASVQADPARLATPLKLSAESGEQYWLGLDNFYVITRYNHSHLYAMAVAELSRELGLAL